MQIPPGSEELRPRSTGCRRQMSLARQPDRWSEPSFPRLAVSLGPWVDRVVPPTLARMGLQLSPEANMHLTEIMQNQPSGHPGHAQVDAQNQRRAWP